MPDGHEHHGRDHHAPAVIANWRDSDLPFLRKLRVAAGNEWRKLRRRQACCGHPGEPGC